MMNRLPRERLELVLRIVGAAVILVSLVLPWFFGQSLVWIVGFAGTVTVQGSDTQVLLIMGVTFMVVVGGLLSFARRSGGVIALIGVLAFVGALVVMAPRGLPFMGVGVLAAFLGSIVVLISPRFKRYPEFSAEGTLQ